LNETEILAKYESLRISVQRLSSCYMTKMPAEGGDTFMHSGSVRLKYRPWYIGPIPPYIFFFLLTYKAVWFKHLSLIVGLVMLRRDGETPTGLLRSLKKQEVCVCDNVRGDSNEAARMKCDYAACWWL
jgi:hypothetical protein